MPRPRMRRRIWLQPRITYFKPIGIPMTELEEIILAVSELEAVRLIDVENMNQGDAAKKMNISQPTFSRTLDSAHKKIAEALVKGKALRVEGGQYIMMQKGRFGQGRGRRR